MEYVLLCLQLEVSLFEREIFVAQVEYGSLILKGFRMRTSNQLSLMDFNLNLIKNGRER